MKNSAMRFRAGFIGVFAAACLAGPVAAQQGSAPASLGAIIGKIQNLESNRDPKCAATANRLEDFIYGTPLANEARYAKIELQKLLIEGIWRDASARAVAAKRENVTTDDLAPAMRKVATLQSGAGGAIVYRTPGGTAVEISARDFEHYASVAYAMRAVLAVEQEQLLSAGARLLPLAPAAIGDLEYFLNVVTLASLQQADRAARLADEPELGAARLKAAWADLAPAAEPSPPKLAASSTPADGQAPAKTDFTVIRSIIEQKIASYAAYNNISQPVFLRNLQVYFARYRWPSDPAQATDFRDTFNSSMVAFVVDVLRQSEARARAAGHVFLRVDDVEPVVESFVPFQVNEYEDVIFFPRLGARKVVLESYDVDAFRDSGIHWRYLRAALDRLGAEVGLEPDPFAAEMIVEGVAQFGVLVLRMAGQIAKQAGADHLHVDHIASAFKDIQARIGENSRTPAPAKGTDTLGSSAQATVAAPGEAFFTEVTAGSGIAFEHRTADWLSRLLRSYLKTGKDTATLSIPPAFGGGGVAAEDIDGDGDADLLLVGGLGNALYLNQGDGRFEDVTRAAGLALLRPDGSHGEPRQPIIADFDNDGRQDILITYVGDGHRFYKGLGKARFEDVTSQAGLGGQGLVGGPAVAFDYDRDGLLDLYIGYFGNYLEGALPTLSRRNVNGTANKLFRNLGGLRFLDVSADSGVENTGWAQAAAHTDLDGDGLQDLIVGNDFGINSYYRNLGDGTFEDLAPRLGTDKPSFTMNVGIADLNRDDYPDIYISNIVTMVKDDKYTLPSKDTPMHLTPETMARMRVVEANDLFTSVAKGGALDSYQLSDAVGRGQNSTGWAWDADFFDFDLDGDDDLYVLNGMNEYAVYSDTPYYTSVHDTKAEVTLPVAARESNVFFVNESGKLQNRSAESGAAHLGNSRSAAYFDLEGDGDLDIVVNNYHGPALLYRNEMGDGKRNWLKVKLVGNPEKGSNRDAIGARLILRADGLKVWREVHGTIGYLSVHPREQHFGLGEVAEGRLSVIWPNGEREELGPLEANNRYVVVQGLGVVAR